ncbi:ATP-dependent helicase [Candidatus Parcubacteria bacterium]|nr:MAG: ATP-dependent helicase [Candidatus Parcubacteria bacterium]
MKFEPTAEQLDIIAAARDTSYNLCISARAGAAKTTTLCMIAEALNQEMLCIAFNKSIVEEMSKRMPKKCTVKTMHSLGYAAWRNYLGRKTRIKVFNGKIVKLLKDYIAEAPEDEKTFLSSEFFDTLDFINRAKINGYCPPEAPTNFVSLVAPEHLETILEFEIPQIQKDAVNWVLRKSAEEALQGNIDFTDMIYCPALCQVTFPRPKITLIDEAQDLSALDHRLLKKIVGKRRIIAVGDEKQAIYAFRGAHTDSMSRLQNTFSMVEMKLTTNFRCATTIIKSVNDFVPDIKARPDAPEGEVKTLPFWSTSDVPDNSAVICRNNAPLIDMAFRFLHDGVPVEINNFGLEKTLYAVVDKLGKPKTDTRIAKDALDA